MRGTLVAPFSRYFSERIIPAHAGNTRRRGPCRRSARDHPRTCGEHMLAHPVPITAWGSSPHMRGTPAAGCPRRSTGGIIPTHAGNTKHQAGRKARSGDHPRTCGEHTYSVVLPVSLPGSSPHMRGTRHAQGRNHRRRGIIPAHAGNTSGRGGFGSTIRDHPRTCGEHCVYSVTNRSLEGSSPHMRGTLSTISRAQTSIRDHPRTCGEHRKSEC